MNNENIYSRLLDALQRPQTEQSAVILGTLSAVEPLTVRVGEQEVAEGLIIPRGTVCQEEDIGAEVALLPCERGLLLLFFTEGGEDV